MKKLFLIVSFAIITAQLYANSILNKTEEINLISNQINHIQEDLYKMDNKNAKLNARLFSIEYQYHFHGLNHLKQVTDREIIIFETLYRNELSSKISGTQFKDGELKESMQKIKDSLQDMYKFSDKVQDSFKILKNNTKIQNSIDKLFPIAKNVVDLSKSYQVDEKLLTELIYSQASISVFTHDKQIKKMLNGMKIIPLDVLLSFQKNALRKHEKALKYFNSKYKKK